MKILAVDSSSKTASVAITEDERVVAEFFMNAGLTHSHTLAPMIDDVLKSANIHSKDIDLYAVTNGPGSFTGLRIGVATVKGMAFASNKPCIGISSLEALACNSRIESGLICACIDARCDQVYTALFESKNGNILRITEDSAELISNLTENLKKMKKSIEFVGDGAAECYNRIMAGENTDKYSVLSKYNCYIKAHNTAHLALKRYESGKFCAAEDLELNYLRVPQAERQLNERLFKIKR